MAVLPDAQSSAVVNVSGVNALTISNINVTAGANALFLLVQWTSGTSPTVTACNWDDAGTPQPMSLVAGTQGASSNSSVAVAIYRLTAPTPGTKNLRIAWSGAALECHAVAISFSGVDQVTPTRNGATNFKATATAPPATVTIASAVGNQVITGFEQQTAVWPASPCSGTLIAKQDSGPAQGTAFSYTAGAASVSPTATWTGSDPWVAWGCDIVAAAGAAALVAPKLATPIRMPLRPLRFALPPAPVPAASIITGTLVLTDANDTISAAGTVAVSGTLSVTDANDTISAAGGVLVTGALTVTEANDTISAAGKVLVGGTLAITEANDTIVAAGTVLVSGTLTVTEANDTIVAAGTVSISGTLSITDANDTISATGTVVGGIVGNLNITEANDTIAASGVVAIRGTLVVTEADDTLSATGFVAQPPVTGALTLTELNDTLAALGQLSTAQPGRLEFGRKTILPRW